MRHMGMAERDKQACPNRESGCVQGRHFGVTRKELGVSEWDRLVCLRLAVNDFLPPIYKLPYMDSKRHTYRTYLYIATKTCRVGHCLLT